MAARDDGMELIIRETTVLDAGYYQCHGNNEFGTASSTPVAVTINGLLADILVSDFILILINGKYCHFTTKCKSDRVITLK